MNKIKDHILLMLGAPVIKIELNKKQINHCVENSIKVVDNLRNSSQKSISAFRVEELTKQYALGSSMIILGHIRGKFDLRDRGYKLLSEVREEFF